MVLAFNNGGDFAKAVYGENQSADSNGTIHMNNVGAMQGGNKKSRRNKNKNNNKKSKRGGKSQRRNRKNQSKRQRGGK